MGRPRALILALLAACAGNDTVGETIFETPAEEAPAGRTGTRGHLARATTSTLWLWRPDGTLAWSQGCQACTPLFVDSDGNVYGVLNDVLAFKRSAADGALVWSRVASVRTTLTIDAADRVWLLVETAQPIDLGGGPIDGPTVWARYAPDGAFLASGALELFLADPRGLPTGGVVGLDAATGDIAAIGDDGRLMWRIETPPDFHVIAYTLHESGEITAIARAREGESTPIARFDANRTQRWRHSVSGRAEALAPLADGSVVVAGFDSLAGSVERDVHFLEQRAGRDGSGRRETLDASQLTLYPSAELDEFRFFSLDDTAGRLVGRRVR